LKLLEKGVSFGGDLVVKNRLAMVPLTRGRCGRTQVPNELNAEYYTQRAKDTGLIIGEPTVISPQAMVFNVKEYILYIIRIVRAERSRLFFY
jgi:2,4-dienoyl-CoA reductase-like NADH-dependent reductase (Old Yellow Enzyme family)